MWAVTAAALLAAPVGTSSVRPTDDAEGVVSREGFDDDRLPERGWYDQFLLAPYFGSGLLPHGQTVWVDELVVGTKRLATDTSAAPSRSGKAATRIAAAQPRNRTIDFRLTSAEVLASVDQSLGALGQLVHKAGDAGCDALALPEDTLLVVAMRGQGSMIISPRGKVLATANEPDGLAVADIDPSGGREGGDAFNTRADMRGRLFRERVDG